MHNNYKNTLNLPKTDFPMQAKLKELEPRILQLWEAQDIYALARRRSTGRKKFILHDGPPYANGDIHLGHALNKILKDFVVKYKIMQGFDVPFVPGWDCHGLPVEHQLFKELGITKAQITKVEFRKKARGFARRFVEIQREQFKRLGLIADWQGPYLTMDFAYESEIVRAFARLTKAKYIYRGLKPINWCINCETALAEAEVEYADRRSPSVYVKFKLVDAEKISLPPTTYHLPPNIYFVIWTTTPWTLISNVAIAVHPEFKYSAIEISPPGKDKEVLILAGDLVEQIMREIQVKDYRQLLEFKGADLENLTAAHPFLGRQARVVLADYISNQEGTGCVHTAPGHGQEDYLTGLKYKLPTIMPVDEQGKFDQTCAEFSGIGVFQANQLIIDKMRKNKSLLLCSDTLHSYPHCWRCKQPLITRSTRQWFINVEHRALRKKALKAAQEVQWVPEAGQARISSMLENRPDWCLSRQRFWGVPIPVFYCQACGKEVLRPQIMERFAKMVAKEGCDAWFTKGVDELLGQSLRCSGRGCKSEQFIKEEDIIDVWFDSGVSHQAVLTKDRDLSFPAALYLEGSDQHRGWFQSALLTSIPLTGRAPYQQVLTHGFVVDAEGKKMSKSRGNVTSPQEIIRNYGAEILRVWVASCDYSDDVRISPQILAGIADGYRKIRNTLRFLLGNLYDFNPQMQVSYSRLQEIDQWALSALQQLLVDVSDDFEHFRYYKVFRRVYNFCTVQLSAFYLDILKDRLYTFGQDSCARRSAQTVLAELLSALTKVIAPIFSFTAEEVWQCLIRLKVVPGEAGDTPTVILERWPKIKRRWINPALDEKMSRISKIRQAVLKAIENEREQGLICSSLEAQVHLYTQDNKLLRFLKANQGFLVTVFIVAAVTIEKAGSLSEDSAASQSTDIAQLAIKINKINFSKCARCWNYRAAVGKDTKHPLLCQRCVEVLEGGRGC